jgi:acyl-CoA thioester hydrolase
MDLACLPSGQVVPAIASKALFKDFLKVYNQLMTTECTLRVRTYECDSYNHVNNANYLNYLEYARYEYLKDINFDYPKAIQAGYGVYIARIEIDYKRPAFVDDTLTIKSKPIKKGAVSGIISQEIWRGDDLLIQAKVTWAFVDSKGQPVKLPAEWDLPGLRPEA